MPSRRVIVINFLVFALGWLFIFRTGADRQLPSGFWLLVLFILVADVIQCLYLRFYPAARRPRLNGQSSSLKEFIMSLAPRSVGDEWLPAAALKDMCGLSECPDPGYTA